MCVCRIKKGPSKQEDNITCISSSIALMKKCYIGLWNQEPMALTNSEYCNNRIVV